MSDENKPVKRNGEPSLVWKVLLRAFAVGVVAIVLFLSGVYAGRVYTSRSSTTLKKSEAQKYFPPIPQVSSVIGEVTDRSDQVVTIKVTSITSNPFEEIPEMRRLIIKENTPIVKLSRKPTAEYSKEIKAYSEQQLITQCLSLGKFIPSVKVSSKPLETPSFYNEEKIDKASLIKIGDKVLADAGRGIKSEAEFTPIKIVIQP